MKVIKRENLIENIKFNCNVSNDTALDTLLKVAGAASEIRLTESDKKPLYVESLVLMGMNVYTITNDCFNKAVMDSMHEVLDETPLDNSYIKELKEDDKRIGKM